MSSGDVTSAIEALTLRPVALAESYLRPDADGRSTALSPFFDALRTMDVGVERDRYAANKLELSQRYGYVGDPTAVQNKPFAFAQGYAIIPIHGVLINRFPYSFGFVTGYNFIRSQVQAAAADPDVTGIVYDVNSPGGGTFGCQETADIIRAASKKGGGKPSVAIVDATCASAAYWLMSAADKIVLTPSGIAGSIGVRMMHVDVSGMLKQDGIVVTYIYSGDHKVEGNQTEPLPKSVLARWQAEGDAIWTQFINTVATNRGLDPQKVRDTQALCYYSEDAKAQGLIDQIAPPSSSLEQFFNDADPVDNPPNPPDDEEEKDAIIQPAEQKAVTEDEHRAAVATAVADATTAERGRIKAIVGGPNAEGRGPLASKLAFDMSMSAEDANGILAASPKEAAPVATAPAAQPAATQPSAGANPFQATMDATGGAGAKPDAGNTGDAGREATAPVDPRRADRERTNELLVAAGQPPLPLD